MGFRVIMKPLLLIFSAAVLLCGGAVSAHAGEDDVKPQKTKSGWSVAPMPTASYTSDTGLQLGALAEIYNYGDGRDYPVYRQKIYLDFGWATKGSTYGHVFFDAPSIFPGIRMTAAATYKVSKMYPFYGFNGLAAPYDETLDFQDGKQTGWYNTNRTSLRLLTDWEGVIRGPLKWNAGVTFWSIRFHELDAKLPAAHMNLFREYQNVGLIGKREAEGGKHLEFKAGLSWDSRDFEPAPRRGIWAEAYFIGSPDLFKTGFAYLKFAAHWRHYVPIVFDKLTFAYHLAYQGTVAGEAPFYMQTNIATNYLKQVDYDGLGSYNSVRGTLYNRLVGAGYAWANIELRYSFPSFDWLGVNWRFGVHPLLDLGKVVQPYRLQQQMDTELMNVSLLYSHTQDQLHVCAGAGAKLAVDYNFILSAEWARSFNRQQDGPPTLTLGVNYIF